MFCNLQMLDFRAMLLFKSCSLTKLDDFFFFILVASLDHVLIPNVHLMMSSKLPSPQLLEELAFMPFFLKSLETTAINLTKLAFPGQTFCDINLTTY